MKLKINKNLNIGFLKAFPSQLVTGWSCGTGFAGVIGAGFYILMKGIGLNDFYVIY